ncbi:MAG: alpha/beta fold hydrolase [Acidiferrobacterales bacterium]
MSALRLILFPGLGADGRMFSGLGYPCRALETPSLAVPARTETMEQYARRVADASNIIASDYIGGCSFGGLVASAIARERPVAGLVLIASAASSAMITPRTTRLTQFSALIPDRAFPALLTSKVFLKAVFGPLTGSQVELARLMLAQTPREMILNGMRLASSYLPADPPICPVYALHGSRDNVMRPPQVPGCRIVPDAGHGLAVTHPELTTEFLRGILCREAGSGDTDSGREKIRGSSLLTPEQGFKD